GARRELRDGHRVWRVFGVHVVSLRRGSDVRNASYHRSTQPSPESTRCRMTPSPRPTSPSGVARVLALVAGLSLVAVTLTACGADPALSEPTNQPTASDTPSTPGDDEESPEPSSKPTGSSHDDGIEGDLADAVSSGDTAPIEDYLTEPTRVV